MTVMKVSEIHPCLSNAEIYGEIKTESLIDDIRKNGILTPIVINQDGIIVSGHRRFACALELGLTEVPCEQIKTTEDTLLQLLVSYNEQRVKSIEDIHREYQALQKIARRDGNTVIDVRADILGVSKGHMHRICKIMESKDPKAEHIRERAINNEIAVGQAYKKIKELEQEALIKENAKQAVIAHELAFGIRHGDFREVLADIPDGSVDAIITDPPYPHQFIDLFGDLAKFASKKLRVGGWLVTYSGHIYLQEVFKQLEDNKSDGLEYYWTMCLLHESSSQLVMSRNLQAGWKPIIVYRKQPKDGMMKITQSCSDVVKSLKKEKTTHMWEQSKSGVLDIVLKFTNEGDLVVDPFAGGGTTLKICAERGRRVIGAEIDDKYSGGKEYAETN